MWGEEGRKRGGSGDAGEAGSRRTATSRRDTELQRGEAGENERVCVYVIIARDSKDGVECS